MVHRAKSSKKHSRKHSRKHRSSAQKKHQARAAKAMKMWKDGKASSLKKAWKMV